MNLSDKIKSHLIEEIKKIFKNNLISIIIYGSYARGDFVKGKSDINILIVRKKRDNKELKALHKIIKKWKYRINIDIPLVLTEQEIKTSTDVYPMEYYDIKEHNIVLYGKDVFKNLKIANKNLRLELENQVKSNVIRLRRHYSVTQSKHSIKKVLLLSIPVFNVVIDNILRLTSQKNSNNKIKDCEKKTKIKLSIISDIENLKKTGLPKSKKDLLNMFETLIITFEKLSDYIDKFKIKKG